MPPDENIDLLKRGGINYRLGEISFNILKYNNI